MLDEIKKYQSLLTDDALQQIKSKLAELKRTHGNDFLNQFKRDFPALVFVVDAVANYPANEAIENIRVEVERKIDELNLNFAFNIGAKETVRAFIKTNHLFLIRYYAELRSEIDKPRF